MADRASIVAEKRDVTGKKVRQLRREGIIPGVIYGQEEVLVVQFDQGELRRVLRRVGTAELIDVAIDGGEKTVLAREIQQHVTRGDVLHVDLYEVNLREKITRDVALHLVGEVDPDVLALGTVALVIQAVTVESLPGDLPPAINVDASQISNPDDMISVADLPVPPGVTILTAPETVITTFDYTRVEEEEEEEEEDLLYAPAADDVEVIKKGKDEDEDEESF